MFDKVVYYYTRYEDDCLDGNEFIPGGKRRFKITVTGKQYYFIQNANLDMNGLTLYLEHHGEWERIKK